MKTSLKQREDARRYYESHRKEVLARQAEYMRRYYLNHPEVKARQAEYQKGCSDWLGCVARVSDTSRGYVRVLARVLFCAVGPGVVV